MKKISLSLTAWIPVILWMGLIFIFSAQPAMESDGLSTKLSQLILTFLDRVIPVFTSGGTVDYLPFLNHLVRKLAHFLLYLILGGLSARALAKNGMTGWKPLVLSVLLCAAYAMTDELHQVFIPGRSGQPGDVLIDSLGGLAGVVLYYSQWGRSRVLR